MSYNEEITSRGNEELEKFQTVENDAQILETLIVNGDEPTSLESHEKINDEVVKTIPEMVPWGEMHEELKNEKMTPIPKTEECTIYLFKKMEATIVKKKTKYFEFLNLHNHPPPKLEMNIIFNVKKKTRRDDKYSPKGD